MELIEFEVGDATVLVEGDPADEWAPARGGPTPQRTLLDALEPVRAAVAAVAHWLSDAGPDQVEVQLGVRLSAGASAIIAKSAAEGHLLLTLRWNRIPPSTL
jgi:hypothetical protein